MARMDLKKLILSLFSPPYWQLSPLGCGKRAGLQGRPYTRI